MQMLEKKLRSSFSDKTAASVSIALDDPGSGVVPRRKPKPTRTARKAGVWNSVADLISTITHHKPDAAGLGGYTKSPRNLSPSSLRKSWSGGSPKPASLGSPKGGHEEEEAIPTCWYTKPSLPANRRSFGWADFGRRRWDSPAPQRPPLTAVWARKSYNDPSDLYSVGPEDRFGPDGGQPNASLSPTSTTLRPKMLSLRQSNRT